MSQDFSYTCAAHAIARAFSRPLPHYGSAWADTTRGHGELTAVERITLDGMVQRAVVRLCRPGSVMVFRVLWEGDPELAMLAMEWHALRFRRPGRNPPDEWGLSIIQRWAGRNILAIRPLSDSRWAKAMGLDRGTVRRMRVELIEQLALARHDGMRIMEPELRARGLIPDQNF